MHIPYTVTTSEYMEYIGFAYWTGAMCGDRARCFVYHLPFVKLHVQLTSIGTGLIQLVFH